MRALKMRSVLFVSHLYRLVMEHEEKKRKKTNRFTIIYLNVRKIFT